MFKIVISLLLSLPLLALQMNKLAPHVTLEGDMGAKVDGSPWSSDSLRGKVHVMFYVDPDEKDTNNALSEALKAQNLDRSKFASVAVINMAATWLPNFAIASKLAKKQEKYPDTIYVKDLQKVIVNAWDVADDSSNIIIFDKQGKVIYLNEGKVADEKIPSVISLVKAAM